VVGGFVVESGELHATTPDDDDDAAPRRRRGLRYFWLVLGVDVG
jgi:hypothetical protein